MVQKTERPILIFLIVNIINGGRVLHKVKEKKWEMGKQEHIVLSIEAVKEIFRDCFKEQDETLLTIFPNSTKLIHQRLDKLVADIIDIDEKLNENVKDVDDLRKILQVYEDTNDKKLVSIDY